MACVQLSTKKLIIDKNLSVPGIRSSQLIEKKRLRLQQVETCQYSELPNFFF